MLWNTIKSLEILEKPEAIFNRRLTANPHYPFERGTDKTKFILHLSSRRHIYSLFMFSTSVVILIFWSIFESAGQFMLFPVLVSIISGLLAWESRGKRTCELDFKKKRYKVVASGHPVCGGEFHNVYIRLKAQKHGAGQMYYYVVFNGYHVVEQKITSYSKNDKKMRILAKRLAENLDINFFDVKASSKERIL
ncbi:predicted protein [Nematostella vectensis]|uniref:Transmembrane protein 249 n=1 Tax=Nematostella vectensis TaxID=45351 RepID=A7SRF4_NEMVE|nr:predicted protein [Nematostella vectensis]|eukprot:XP_001625802.1 predicted protein [Nematostella vectensis]